MERRSFPFHLHEAPRDRALIVVPSPPLISHPQEDPPMRSGTAPGPVTGRNLIGGKWLPVDGSRFESHNPARLDEVLGAFPASSAEVAGRAVAAARAAFPGWRRTSR